MADRRWDDAAAMLHNPSLREFLPAKKLSRELADQLLDRAELRLLNGQSTGAWNDVESATALGATDSRISELRSRETSDRLSRAIARLGRGDVAAARRELDRMDRLNLGGSGRRDWQAIVQNIEQAEQQSRKGHLPAAVGLLEDAQRLLPDEGGEVVGMLAERLATLRTHWARQQTLDGQLHAALTANDWSVVLRTAESLLELAPENSAARQARQKAWEAVGLEVTQPYRGKRSPVPAPRVRGPIRLGSASHSTRRGAGSAKDDTVTTDREQGQRIVAWIDEVGAYLVCLGNEIVLGQPAADGGVDVPILADLSRRHATIRRDGEAYVLVPLHDTAIDGRPIVEPTVLRDKSLIKLGAGVELRFRKPHALSATAVLEIVSHHRTEPAVDGIVLMSESCILGPQSHSHVRCRQWSSDLVLFRRGGQLMCRTQSPVQIDGEPGLTQAALSGDCRIECDEFAVSLEEL